jgi:hypothetical protein
MRKDNADRLEELDLSTSPTAGRLVYKPANLQRTA